MGWNNPPVPWRDLERTLSWGGPKVFDPDADAAAVEQAARRRVAERRRERPAAGESAVPYSELHCHSHFSFLDGVSDPADLVREALQLGLPALAITDHDGFYGAVRFATSAKGTPLKTIYGSELSLGLTAAQTGIADPEGHHLLVLARSPEGYRRLSAAIGAAQLAGGEKGKPVYGGDQGDSLEALGAAAHGHWAVLTGCRKGAVPAALIRHGITETGLREAETQLRRLVEAFGPEAVHVELVDHDQPMDDDRNDALAHLAGKLGLPTVATNNVHYAHPVDYQVATALAALRARRTLDEMDGWLPAAGAMHLRSGAEMAARFARFPGILQRTTELGLDCAFDLQLVNPQLPDFPVPEGHTEASWLRELTLAGAAKRYGSPQERPKEYRQIEAELEIITRLNYPGYFLIVHNIAKFCEDENILCQGRGSAANSAVCYALGITNVDSVEYNLLFARFLSAERGEPPDIDLDIESRRREEVIQYVYNEYGRDYAAQVANVICYRPRMALRDAARVLGYSMGTIDAWSRQLGPHDPLPTGDPDDVIPEPVTALARRLEKLPRHLGIHSGGMVICDRPVAQVCPTEWARMENRSVLQWDK
ncbi:MAG TPA: PHP domain-containing protein, partial [Mycobacteriales bacterium]|nr:PHP domain-containing protein [Mycobacteriales bacterium]